MCFKAMANIFCAPLPTERERDPKQKKKNREIERDVSC